MVYVYIVIIVGCFVGSYLTIRKIKEDKKRKLTIKKFVAGWSLVWGSLITAYCFPKTTTLIVLSVAFLVVFFINGKWNKELKNP